MFRRTLVRAAAFAALLAVGPTSAAVGGGCAPKAAQAGEGTGVVVSIADCAFGPTILYAPVGATVTWTNGDYLPHAVAGAGWTAQPLGTFSPGASVRYTFTAPGIYPYMCALHPGMAAVVVVGDVAFPAPSPAPIAPADAAASATAGLPAAEAPAPVELPLAGALAIGAALGGYALARWPRRWTPSAAAIRAVSGERREPRLGDYQMIELPVGDEVDRGTDRPGEHDHAVPRRRSNA